MKKLILSFMAAVVLANSAFAMSPAMDADGWKDYTSVQESFIVNEETIVVAADAVSDWDYFWGTTVSQALDPKTNGWDEFWFQCQDPDKSVGDCVGTVFAGGGIVLAATLVVVGATIATAGLIPMAGTAVAPVAGFAEGWSVSAVVIK